MKSLMSFTDQMESVSNEGWVTDCFELSLSKPPFLGLLCRIDEGCDGTKGGGTPPFFSNFLTDSTCFIC